MVRILEILDLILDRVRVANPFDLVLKGGTALALHHLDHHRESEDLDFDVPAKYGQRPVEVAAFITKILDELVAEEVLKGFTVRKQGMAATNRYHMNLTLETYKPFFTKIDFDYTDLPQQLEYEGQLAFYTAERMFVAKLLTFKARRELKDIYDISFLLPKVKPDFYGQPAKLAALIEEVTKCLDDEALVVAYQKALRELDLRFKHLQAAGVPTFIEKNNRALLSFRNELLKR